MARVYPQPMVARVADVYAKVLAFVNLRAPALGDVALSTCSEVRRGLKSASRRRAFMHTGHEPTTICVHPDTGRLSDGYLVGLLLHEFGHCAIGESEAGADQWVFRVLGVAIQYRGPGRVEWVTPDVVACILGGEANPRGKYSMAQLAADAKEDGDAASAKIDQKYTADIAAAYELPPRKVLEALLPIAKAKIPAASGRTLCANAMKKVKGVYQEFADEPGKEHAHYVFFYM